MSDNAWEIRAGRGIGDFALGESRAAVLHRLEATRQEVDVDPEDPTLVELVEEGIALRFALEGSQPLVLIEVCDERMQWGGEGLPGLRAHELLPRFEVQPHETVWRRWTGDSSDDEYRPGTEVSDQTLLESGTLWLRPYGLGLCFSRGGLSTVLITAPERVPRDGYGHWTAAQAELSQTLRPTVWQPASRPGRKLGSALRIVLTIGLLGALGWLFQAARQYQARWDQVPVVPGTIVDVQPPPPEPFPERYTVEYVDDRQHTHRVVWGLADLYVPREMGEIVEVRYLPEAPDQPRSPGRYRDAAFLKFFPFGIAAVALYGVLQLIVWGMLRLQFHAP